MMSNWMNRVGTAAAPKFLALTTVLVVGVTWCACAGSARAAPPGGPTKVEAAQALATEPRASTELIGKHIEYLASPELEGRGGGRGKQLARQYIINQFRALQLEP